MQRVSTAFVAQVSAPSSTAIVKLRGCARAINDPGYVPLASSHRAQSRPVLRVLRVGTVPLV